MRGSVSQGFRLGPRTVVNGFGSAEHRDILAGSWRSQRIWGLGASGSHRFHNGDVLEVLVVAQRAVTGNAFLEYAAVRGQVVYRIGRPVLGTAVSLTTGLLHRKFPVSRYAANGRRDLLFNAGITVMFDQVSAYGFAPFTVIEFRQTKSNIALYERRSFAVRMGIQSTF